MPAVGNSEKCFISVCANKLGCLLVHFILIALMGIERLQRFTEAIILAVRATHQAPLHTTNLHLALCFVDVTFSRGITNFTSFAELLCKHLASLAISTAAADQFL